MRSITLALLSCLVIALCVSPDTACAAAKKKKKAPPQPVVAMSNLSGPDLVRRALDFYDNGDFKRAMADAQNAESVLENGKRTKESDALLATAKCIIADLLVIKRQGGDKTISLDAIMTKITEGLRLDPAKANIDASFRNPETRVYANSALTPLIKQSTEAYNSAKAALASATFCQQWKDVGKAIQFYPDRQLAAALVEDSQFKCGGGPALGGNGLLCLPFVVRDKNGGDTPIEGLLTPTFMTSELRSAFRNVVVRVVSPDSAGGYMKSLGITDWGEFTVSPWVRFVKDDPSDVLPSSYVNELPKIYRRRLQSIARAETAKWVCAIKAESAKSQGTDIDVDLQLDIYNQADPAKPVISLSKRVGSTTLVVERFREMLRKAAGEFSRLR